VAASLSRRLLCALIYRRSRFALLAGCIILFEVAFETLVIAGWQPRYRLPVDIMLMAFAGVVYAELAARWFGGQKKLEWAAQ
jgi:hypothetical protein